MTRPSRRGVLGGLAALSAPVLPAVAASASPDAALIRCCARFLELERIINDPDRDHSINAGDMPEWVEYEAIEDVLCTLKPRTRAGAEALARVALDCADARDQGWEAGGLHATIARNLLEQIARGAA